MAVLVLGPVAQRLVQARLAPFDHSHDRLADSRQVVGVAHVHRRELEVFFNRVAEHPLARRRQVHDLALGLDARDHVGRMLGQEPVALLALKGGGFRPLHIGDVGQCAVAREHAAGLVVFDGAPGNDVADFAVGAHDPDFHGRILARVRATVLSQFAPVVGMAGRVERRQRRRPSVRIKAVDLVDLVGPGDPVLGPIVVPVAEASHLGREGRQPLEVLRRRPLAGQARGLACIRHGPFSPNHPC